MKPKILAFSGSTRQGSFNKKLAKAAADYAEQAGAVVTYIDLKNYPMPLYEGDLETEQGIPEHARKLRQLIAEHQGLIIATPEYNGFMPPLIKNCLDWVSRPDGDESGLDAYRGKIAVLLAASPGGLGGIRALPTLRQLLNNLGVIVLPNQLAVPRAHLVFNDTGTIKDAKVQESLEKTISALTSILKGV